MYCEHGYMIHLKIVYYFPVFNYPGCTVKFFCMGPASMIVLIIAAVVFSLIAMFASKLLLKATRNKQKGEPYECGIPTQGKTWVRFNVGYYLFALIFLIFDVELIFLYPWAVAVKQVGWIALVEIIIFFSILFIGLLYAHKKGALKWT